jgi:uncharacterized protein YlaI
MWRTSCKIVSSVDIGERASERIEARNDPWVKWRCRECSNKIAEARQWSERNGGAQRTETRCNREWLVGGDHHA